MNFPEMESCLRTGLDKPAMQEVKYYYGLHK